MSFFSSPTKSVSKRSLLKSAGFLIAAGLIAKPGLAFAGTATIDVTAAPYNATPGRDCSAAFQAALNAIAANGGGRLYVPGGCYTFTSPLTYSGGSLTIAGDGQALTVLQNNHSGSALTVNLNDTSKCLTVQSLGFSPCPGNSLAASAITLNVPPAASGWQNALIQDVCIGVPGIGNGQAYTAYQTAISLVNTTRARINNVNIHGNNIGGGVAIGLSGRCMDTRILGCTLEGYMYGVAVLSYCEGIHLSNNVIICQTAVFTGTSTYANSGNINLNVLEIFVNDCEINTYGECMFLYQVKNAQIVNCHFTGPKNGNIGAAIDMRGCVESLIENCTFCGTWSPGGTPNTGIAFMPSAAGTATSGCNVSNVQFENVMVGLGFGAGAQGNVATNVALLTYGTGGLVNGSAPCGNQTQQVYCDMSGNTTNNVSWSTTGNTVYAGGGRRIGSEH